MNNGYKKESGLASVLGVFAAIAFTISLVATLIILPTTISFKLGKAPGEYIVNASDTEEEVIKINNYFKNNLKDGSKNYASELPTEYVSKEFFSTLMVDVINAQFYDKDSDYDKITDDFKSDIKNVLKANGYEYSDYQPEIDTYCESYIDSFKAKTESNQEDSVIYIIGRVLEELYNRFKIASLICICLTIVFGLAIWFIYKKKFCSMLNLGISNIIAGIIAACAAALIILPTTFRLTPVFKFFADRLTFITYGILGISVFSLIAGIVLIVRSSSIKTKYIAKSDII
ncbi:MAG: hypothetical protein E7252_10425 [Lachnospira sp.]|nr:hypothetical protein [Lachnospira sp.]